MINKILDPPWLFWEDEWQEEWIGDDRKRRDLTLLDNQEQVQRTLPVLDDDTDHIAWNMIDEHLPHKYGDRSSYTRRLCNKHQWQERAE